MQFDAFVLWLCSSTFSSLKRISFRLAAAPHIPAHHGWYLTGEYLLKMVRAAGFEPATPSV